MRQQLVLPPSAKLRSERLEGDHLIWEVELPAPKRRCQNEGCLNTLEGKRSHAKFCSPACRSQANSYRSDTRAGGLPRIY